MAGSWPKSRTSASIHQSWGFRHHLNAPQYVELSKLSRLGRNSTKPGDFERL